MSNSPQEQFAQFAILAALPETGDAPPEWVTLFPRLGDVTTVDGRRYFVDAQKLIANFASGGVDIAFDINHATEIKAPKGEDAPAVAWAKELRVENGALQARVEWLAAGAEAVATKSYRYLSPSFWHTKEGRTTRLKSIALTNSPALLEQPALAHAQQEQNMQVAKLAAAIGVVATANEDAMLAALDANFVPKGEHEKAVLAAKKIGDDATAALAVATAELDKIKEDARKAKVDGLIESALSAGKILPAERDDYVALCATDDGYERVAKLFAAKGVILKTSGLDNKKAPDAGASDAPTGIVAQANLMAAKAKKMVEDGEASDFVAAVSMLSAKAA